jgi:ribosome-binding factor A
VATRRQQRVSELLQEELSIVISAELQDECLADAMVNVTDVEVSPDLRNARVYIEHVLPPAASRQLLAALDHAKHFLRRALLENLNLRFVPDLSFAIDNTAARGQRIDALLDSISATSVSAGPDPLAQAQESPLHVSYDANDGK